MSSAEQRNVRRLELGEIEQDPASVVDAPLDVLESFGPMAAMHAAMDRLGVGMPCGFVLRFEGRSLFEVQRAVETARRKFTVLERCLDWADPRAKLVLLEMSCRDARVPNISLNFKSDPHSPLWRYSLIQDGDDVWLAAVFAHAAADGASMLRFAATIAAAMEYRPAPRFLRRAHSRTRPGAMAGWLLQFLFEQNRTYVRPNGAGSHNAGIAWLNISPDRSDEVLKRAQAECGSFAAWLGSLACTALCEQQGLRAGRVLLNLPILRDDAATVGGFGFGASSLMMPVKYDAAASLPARARSIATRLKNMTDQGWDTNFERFLGNSPKYLRFQARHADGHRAQIVSVSWKGADWQLGGGDGVRDLACFAVSPAWHISAHSDRNGLSVSVASSGPAAAREDLVRRLANQLDEKAAKRIRTFDGREISCSAASSP
jgi:hypothetical protein